MGSCESKTLHVFLQSASDLFKFLFDDFISGVHTQILFWIFESLLMYNHVTEQLTLLFICLIIYSNLYIPHNLLFKYAWMCIHYHITCIGAFYAGILSIIYYTYILIEGLVRLHSYNLGQIKLIYYYPYLESNCTGTVLARSSHSLGKSKFCRFKNQSLRRKRNKRP